MFVSAYVRRSARVEVLNPNPSSTPSPVRSLWKDVGWGSGADEGWCLFVLRTAAIRLSRPSGRLTNCTGGSQNDADKLYENVQRGCWTQWIACNNSMRATKHEIWRSHQIVFHTEFKIPLIADWYCLMVTWDTQIKLDLCKSRKKIHNPVDLVNL